MGNPLGSFIWYELTTPDQAGAAAFYGAVVGWSFVPPHPDAPIAYGHILRSDGGSLGGVLTLSPEMRAGGARPCWMPYLSVESIDAAVDAILADGGHVLMPRTAIEVGSFALVTDPQGTPFYLMAPIAPAGMPDATSDVFSVTEPQHVRWNELTSPDLAAAKAFYARHFGFTFDNTMPMGEMGDYCFIGHHGQTLGAIMQRPAGDPCPPLWLLYFGVPSVSAATAAITAGGGTVAMGPHQVPGGEWITVAIDPQGAMFGVVGPKGD